MDYLNSQIPVAEAWFASPDRLAYDGLSGLWTRVSGSCVMRDGPVVDISGSVENSAIAVFANFDVSRPLPPVAHIAQGARR